jgi:hypothetical protein
VGQHQWLPPGPNLTTPVATAASGGWRRFRTHPFSPKEPVTSLPETGACGMVGGFGSHYLFSAVQTRLSGWLGHETTAAMLAAMSPLCGLSIVSRAREAGISNGLHWSGHLGIR